jgi:hypothetical protein
MTDTDRPLTRALNRLSERYPRLDKTSFSRVVSAIASSPKVEAWRDIAVTFAGLDVTAEVLPLASKDDALDALEILAVLRRMMDADERLLIDLARGQGATWPEVAKALTIGSPQGANQRRKRLGDKPSDSRFLDPDRAAVLYGSEE